MILTIGLLAILLSLVSVWFNWERNKAVVFFATFVISYSLFIITHQVIVYSDNPILFALFYNHLTPLFYLAGPALYFYFRALVEDKITFHRFDAIHFVPALITLIGITPFYFTSWEEKLEIANLIISDFDFYKVITPNRIVPVELNNILRPLLLLFYAFLSLKLIKGFLRDKSGDGPLFKHYKSTQRWGFFVLITISLTALSYLVPLSLYLDSGIEEAHQKAYYWQFGAVILFTLLPISLIIFPNVVYGFVRFNEDVSSLTVDLKPRNVNAFLRDKRPIQLPITPTNSESNDKPLFSSSIEIPAYDMPTKGFVSVAPERDYSTMELTKDLDLLGSAIETYFRDEKPYLKTDFKVHDVALYFNISAHHISFCFSQHFKVTFAQYKTRYRVEYAIQLLKRGEASQSTIETVGLKAGFASKSNFFKAFRDITGLTPQQYLTEQKTP
jgi:AraC-like DNA-binding protein